MGTLGWGFPDAGACCCGGGASGYTAGGNLGGTYFTRCDKTDFATETTASTTTADLSLVRTAPAAAGNPGLHGYYAGGQTASGTNGHTRADKLTFASDTTASATTADLSLARYRHGAVSERSTKAYFCGGQSSARVVTTDKLTFSGDSTAACTTADLSLARNSLSGVTDGSTKGYLAGGQTGLGAFTTRCDMITYSTDTSASTTTANLSLAREEHVGFSDGATFGWWGGGHSSSGTGRVDRVTFSTDTTASRSAASLSTEAGYAMSDGATAIVTQVSTSLLKFVESTETTSTLGAPANLSQLRTYNANVCTVAL